jgi:hypothetical protein
MAYIGKNFNVGIQYGTESAYGTEVATNIAIGKVTGFTPTINNSIRATRGVGDGRNPNLALWGIFDCGGNIVWELHDFTFLKYWIGPISGAGTSGSKYTLTESATVGTTTSTDILPFSLEVGDEEGTTDDVLTFTGCVGNDFTIEGSIGNPVTCSANFVAQKVTQSGTATAYTATTTPPWMYQQVQYKYGTTPSAVTKIQSWSITMTNNLYTYRENSRFISQPEPGLREYTWSITCLASDTNNTAFQNAAFGSSGAPATGITSAEYTSDEELHILMAEGTSASQRQAEIKLDDCWINTPIKTISLGGDVIMLVVNGGAKSAHTNKFVEWWTN